MIILITGLSGSGKTNTAYALLFSHYFNNCIFIESEWFSAKVPFDWKNKRDIESIYLATEKVIDFNLNRGEDNFVITLGLPQLKHYDEFIKYFQKGIPIILICLTCDKKEIIRRIHERGRHARQRLLELDAVDPDYKYLSDFISHNHLAHEINTTRTTEKQVASLIIEIVTKHGEQSNSTRHGLKLV
jgi:broad-specificity NMP kinase